MLITAVGHTGNSDPRQAVVEICQQVEAALREDLPYACILFSGQSKDFDQQLIAELFEWRPDLQLIGCSSFAEASSRHGAYTEHSVAMMFFGSDTINFASGALTDLAHRDQQQIQAQASQALAPLHAARAVDKTPKLCIVFTEFILVNQNAVIQALQNELGEQVYVIGGGAAHPKSFDLDQPTRQYLNTECLHRSAVFMIFSGPLALATGVYSGGWYPIYEQAMPVVIKPAQEAGFKEIQWIDNQPALDFYEQAVGTKRLPGPLRDQLTICYPLMVHYNDERHEFDCFDVLMKNRSTNALVVSTEFPDECRINISEPVWQDVLKDVKTATEATVQRFWERAPVSAAALFVSCCSRSVAYQAQAHASDEYQAIANACRPDLPILGYYGYTEIGSRSDQPGTSRQQGMSLIFLLLGEDWEAIQKDTETTDHVRLQQIITAIKNERTRSSTPITPSPKPKPNREYPKITNAKTKLSIDNPTTRGFAKVETLLIELGVILRLLEERIAEKKRTKRREEKAILNRVGHWLSPENTLVAKRVAASIVKDKKSRTPKANTVERHISHAIKIARDQQNDIDPAKRVYNATLILGALLVYLEDCGGEIPQAWQDKSFASEFIAASIYQRLRDHPHCPYTDSQEHLAKTLDEAKKVGKEPGYEVDDWFLS